MNNSQIKLNANEISYEALGISLSEKAVAMAKRATLNSDENASELFLRISIKGGGCAGLQYNLDIDEKMLPLDLWCQTEGLKIAVDNFSWRYLKNTAIDYQESLEGAGFKFNNPNARKTCGCGSSFS